jgi:hypothetical protein
MKKVKSVIVVAVFGFGLIASLFPATTTFAGSGTRLECKAFGSGDTSMDARYEEKEGREKLSVSFEATPGGSFAAGNVLEVKVNDTFVGSMILDRPGGVGDIVGDIDFDSNEDDPNAEDLPFPSIVVGDGDVVMVSSLGCGLED